jgi:hypothetical protein
MAHKKQLCAAAHAQHQETRFIEGVRLVVELDCKIVIENRLRFFKRNAVLPEIRGGFRWVPVKLDHIYTVWKFGDIARALWLTREKLSLDQSKQRCTNCSGCAICATREGN